MEAERGDGCDGLTMYERVKSAGRRDGRTSGELRGLKVEQDLLERCDGSARLSCGGTEVLVAAYGPVECPLKAQLMDRAVVSVSVRGGEATTLGSLRWFEKYVRDAVEPSVLIDLHPRTAINIIVHILEEDGSVLAAAVNAATLALVDAGVPMRSLRCAASIALNSASTLVLDPTITEESDALVHATFTFDSVNRGLAAAKIWGFFDDEDSYFTALTTAERATDKVLAFLRLAIERKTRTIREL